MVITSLRKIANFNELYEQILRVVENIKSGYLAYETMNSKHNKQLLRKSAYDYVRTTQGKEVSHWSMRQLVDDV